MKKILLILAVYSLATTTQAQKFAYVDTDYILNKIPDFKGKIDIEIIDKNDYIEISIVDNGKGFEILAENLKNILNPYFTTKKKGTGLGLAIVNKIINDHNSSINFIPLVNGAKVKIVFLKNEH